MINTLIDNISSYDMEKHTKDFYANIKQLISQSKYDKEKLYRKFENDMINLPSSASNNIINYISQNKFDKIKDDDIDNIPKIEYDIKDTEYETFLKEIQDIQITEIIKDNPQLNKTDIINLYDRTKKNTSDIDITQKDINDLNVKVEKNAVIAESNKNILSTEINFIKSTLSTTNSNVNTINTTITSDINLIKNNLLVMNNTFFTGNNELNNEINRVK